MIVPLQGLRNRAKDVVISVLGAADDDDHRGLRAALAAQVIGRGDQLIRDRAVPALEVPALGGAPQVRGPQVRGLQVRADLDGQLAGDVVEALLDLG